MNMSSATQKQKQTKKTLPNCKTTTKWKKISLYTVRVIPLIPLICVYCLYMFIVYIYIVDYYLEKAMNLLITYTYLLICLLPLPPS